MTRARVIQVWFTAVALAVVAALALGAHVTVGTAAMLFGLSLVPAGVVLALWPREQTLTVGEVLRGADRRP